MDKEIKKAMDGLNRFMESMFAKNRDTSKWAQVGKLSKQDEGKRKSLMANRESRNLEMEMLVDKIKTIQAGLDAKRTEWWFDITKTHGLLPDGNFHIADNGRILMEPKKENDD